MMNCLLEDSQVLGYSADKVVEQTFYKELMAYAKNYPTEEICGFILAIAGQHVFRLCSNEAYDKKVSFLIHPKDYIACANEGEIVAVVHSHVNEPADPSPADMASAENCKLPFLIVNPHIDTWAWYEPSGYVQPLEGRVWCYGVNDCFTLVQDYYKGLGVPLKDLFRTELFWEKGENWYAEKFGEWGFTRVLSDFHVHDVVLIQIKSDIPNHAAVLQSDGTILHHVRERISCKDVYDGYWRRHTWAVLRHNKFL